MVSLRALDMPLGPGLVDAIIRCRDAGIAFCVLDQRLSPVRARQELDLLGATEVEDPTGQLERRWMLTYNFLPFMLLPIYVSLEKIDRRLFDAAADLSSPFAATFRKVILPLSLPGVFAVTLLTFIPATGDFINAEFLGSPKAKQVIGKAVQIEFLNKNNYPSAAAISFVLMAIITTLVLVYTKFMGTEDLA